MEEEYVHPYTGNGAPGLRLLDHIAIQAMNAIVSACGGENGVTYDAETVAFNAYALAKAMLDERDGHV